MPQWGGRVVQWCWVNFRCLGVLLIWLLEQGPTALAVGAGGGCLDIYYFVYHFSSSFSVSVGDVPIQTETLSQRPFYKQEPTRNSLKGGYRSFGIFFSFLFFFFFFFFEEKTPFYRARIIQQLN